MKGILLTNLGSTKSPKVEDVKNYLDEFLMDEYALDLPYWLRSIVVRKIILKSRPPKTAANYERIWWKEGSPLIVISERLCKKLDQLLDIPVTMGMRYGEPSIQNGLQELVDRGADEVIVLPMYPQYTMSTIKTAVEKIKSLQQDLFPNLKITVLPPFYKQPDYIDLLAKSIDEVLHDKDYDYLLFTYHGIPKRHERKSHFTENGQKITYRDQCLETSRLVAEKLGLQKEQYSTSFQSRLGIDPWIKPFTDDTLKALPGKGVKKLAVVASAFVADCIETLDEIDREGREEFMSSGGEEFIYIPCLNDRDDWAEVLKSWVTEEPGAGS